MTEDKKFQLSHEEIIFFKNNGYLGPIYCDK